MKNLTFLFLLLPFFLSAQYGVKNCRTDLVFGYDYGNRFSANKIDEADQNISSSLQTIRFGTNISYPLAASSHLLVSGFRLSSRFASEKFIFENDDPIIESTHQEKKSADFFGEIPFQFRFFFKDKKKESRFFLEAGPQFNFYLISLSKEEFKSNILGFADITT